MYTAIIRISVENCARITIHKRNGTDTKTDHQYRTCPYYIPISFLITQSRSMCDWSALNYAHYKDVCENAGAVPCILR
jgi:hypothetical protein